jgi:hypothetical protein
MEILLGGNDVDHLVELVLLVPLPSASDIPRDVDTRSVLLPDDRLAQLVFLEIDDQSTLGLLDDAGSLQRVEGVRLRRLRDLRFAGVDVEVDVEASVSLLVLYNREISELFP